MRGRMLRALAVAAALTFGVGVAALTTRPGDGQVNLIAHSVDAAEAAGMARMSMTMSGPGMGTSGSFEGSGLVDLSHDAASMTFDLSSLAGSAGRSLPAGAASMEMRILGTRMYMHMPFLTSQMGQGDKWLEVDLAKIDQLKGLLDGNAMQGNDPADTLGMLRGASDTAPQKVGTELVRGVSTTHYRASIDMQQALAKVPADRRANLQKLFEQSGQTGSVPVDVWLDGAGLPRRMTIQQTVPGAGAVSMTMELYDFGVKATIEAPPGDQTIDMSGMLNGFMGDGGGG